MRRKLLPEIAEKSVKITDLYLNHNYELFPDDEDFNDEEDVPFISYYLSASKEGGSSSFLITFKCFEPIIASIEVNYYEVERFGEESGFSSTKFKKSDKDNETIYFIVNGSDEPGIEYREQRIEHIIPMDIFYSKQGDASQRL